MAARGSYAKGVAKREEILTTALDVIARNGYRKTSIKELAAAVGLSQTGLLHYFGTKEDLFAEILRKRDAVDSSPYGTYDEIRLVDGDVGAGLSALARHNSEVPGLVQLYSQFSAEVAADPAHPARQLFVDRYAQYRDVVANAVRAQQQRGSIPESIDPTKIATLVAAANDGLQVQWMLDPTIDMAEHIAYFWELLGRP